jgi:hypothetical protein
MGLCNTGDKGNMTLDRRRMMGLSAAGVAGMMMAGLPAWAQGNSTSTEFLDHFSAKGFEKLKPLSLLTEFGFNGGLRYDDTRSDYPAGPSVCVQPACRIDDIGKANKPGVLALFNIMVVNVPDASLSGTAAEQLLEFAIEHAGLDPAKIVYVSTDLFEPYLKDSALLQKGQFVRRERGESMTTGEGSGFFAPAGHPQTPGFPTVSIHYPINADTEPDMNFPLPDHLEIGEIILEDRQVGRQGPVGGGFGLERLALASGKPAPDFTESRVEFLRLARLEAEETGRKLPVGYEAYSTL